MKKLLFSALACVAFAGSGFASNEIVVDLPSVPEEKVDSTAINSKDKTENVTAKGHCTTETYGYYQGYTISPSTIMDPNMEHSYTITYHFVITGQCTICHLMGPNGVAVTRDCWGSMF